MYIICTFKTSVTPSMPFTFLLSLFQSVWMPFLKSWWTRRDVCPLGPSAHTQVFLFPFRFTFFLTSKFPIIKYIFNVMCAFFLDSFTFFCFVVLPVNACIHYSSVHIHLVCMAVAHVFLWEPTCQFLYVHTHNIF